MTMEEFQSTRPRGARLSGLMPVERRKRFQSTRPRGARRRLRQQNRAHPAISIHAPAWGATTRQIGRSEAQADFNPRARVGRDMSRRETRS